MYNRLSIPHCLTAKKFSPHANTVHAQAILDSDVGSFHTFMMVGIHAKKSVAIASKRTSTASIEKYHSSTVINAPPAHTQSRTSQRVEYPYRMERNAITRIVDAYAIPTPAAIVSPVPRYVVTIMICTTVQIQNVERL